MNLGVFRPKVVWIMPWLFQYFWILPFCMGSIITIVDTEQTSNFTWNKTNPKFNDKEGAKLSVPVGSNFKIICPQANNSAPEYYVIYWVSAAGFNGCFLPSDSEESQVFVICNKPYEPLEFTVEITIFSGTPGAKDFEVGKSYYITTFSTGTYNGLGNTFEGACKDNNMKLNLTITEQQLPSTAAPSGSPSPQTSGPPVTSTPKPTTTTPRPTTKLTTVTSTEKTTLKLTSTRPPYTTDIPVPTDSTDNIINVPDNGNTGVIDITNHSARTLCATPVVLLSLCLSFFHILYGQVPLIQR